MRFSRFPVLCDLDGVIWLAHQPLPGSTQAIERLRAMGHEVLFVTNNSFSTMEQQYEALANVGIEAEGSVITSPMAAATLVTPGDRVMVLGGAGIVEAMEQRGAEVVDDRCVDVTIDAVVVGLHRALSYDGLANAAHAIRNGARLIGTNEDATFPTPRGPVPGGGAILAALQVASGHSGVIAGKPHEPMAEAVRAHLGVQATALPSWWPQMVMVGDRPSTDGAFAHQLGCRFALVRTGVTSAGESVEVTVHVDGRDLAEIVDLLA
jgi:HAD superfamily hydrolase (TIGR01450 family)